MSINFNVLISGSAPAALRSRVIDQDLYECIRRDMLMVPAGAVEIEYLSMSFSLIAKRNGAEIRGPSDVSKSFVAVCEIQFS